MKIITIPAPMGAEERTCGTQIILGLEVQANQKRPTGRKKAPMTKFEKCQRGYRVQDLVRGLLIGGRRSSGGTRPAFANFRANRVFVI
jgi:hypothetical protein